MRTPLDALVTEKSLEFISVHRNADLLDHLLEGRIQVQGNADMPVKNVCAKVPGWLSDEIDQIVGLLGCSKRRFLEAAFLEAVTRARQIMEAEGVTGELVSNEERAA